MSENKRIAKKLIACVGGPENIESVTHCATRMRFIIRDEEKVDKESVEEIDKVKGAFFNSGQYQVIFGTGTVNRVYEEIEKLDLKTSTKAEQSKEAVKATARCPYFWRCVCPDHSGTCCNRTIYGTTWAYHAGRDFGPVWTDSR